MVDAEAARLMDGAAMAEWSEWVVLKNARGRILAQRVLADRDQPPFARSTRDGFAVRVEDLKGDGGELAIAGSTRAGEQAAELPENAAWEILTGATVPRGADAVVMQEFVEASGGVVRFAKTPKVGENIVQQGAEARAGEMLLGPGYRMGAAEIGLAAGCGYTKIRVRTRPRVVILTTGDELVEPDEFPGAGQIRNSNGAMLCALAEEAGAEAIVLPTARDEGAALDAAIAMALKCAGEVGGKAPALLVIAGGVSVGRFDLVEEALGRKGARFHFTGVAIQPGRPVVFGEIPSEDSAEKGPKSEEKAGDAGAEAEKSGLKFFGLPGNPVSAGVTFRLFVEPILGAMVGAQEWGPQFLVGQLENAWKGKSGLTRFLPGVCEMREMELPGVELVAWKGSGDLTAFARANCLVVIPAEASEIAAGERVRILMR